MFVKMRVKAADLKKGSVYKILEEGLDWYRIKVKGRPRYVDKCLVMVVW